MNFEANSWASLLDNLREIRRSVPNVDYLWFRGQSNASYALLPSLFRSPSGREKEEQLFQKFRQLSLRVLPRRTDNWETLFDMQHYGVPTRLLDWTPTLGIAAFFAAAYANRDKSQRSAAIYVLDPIRLNEYSRITGIPFLPDDKRLDYRSVYFEKKPFAPVYPIAVEPIFSNDRMAAQIGAFTIHGDNLTPIETLCPEAVKKIILSGKAISETLEFCELANINEFTIFPDVAGIASHVRRIARFD
jgi:hypothetical protein